MINERLARKYCKEDISKIKNYDAAIADTTQTWDYHHMTETWWNCSAKDLIENECYYTEALKNRTFTEEHRRKLREASRRRWTLHKKKINGGTVNGCDF